MQIADIMIHITEKLETSQQQELESELRENAGVIAPRFNLPQLFVVCYDPEKTSSFELLNTVRARGYTASLIGG